MTHPQETQGQGEFVVRTFDVTGAYLHANPPREKHVILKLRGEFVEIMREVNP